MLARTPPEMLHDLGPSRQTARRAKRAWRERATIDFETRSIVDLPKRGSWIYANDPSTKILCMAYHVPGMDEDAIKCWHPAFPHLGIPESEPPTELIRWIKRNGLVEAHNSFFEMCIWHHIAVPTNGWPEIPFANWRCSAAKAAQKALPRALDEACEALDLPVRKDPRGKELLRLLSKPKKLTKADKKEFGKDAVIFREDADLFYELWQYCKQDVRAEVRLSKSVADLSDMELRVWQVTQDQNWRGVLIDTDLCRAALKMAAKMKAKLNAELAAITGIPDLKGTQRDQVKAWLAEHEFEELPDTKAKTLEHYIDTKPISATTKRVLQIVREVNRTSINKYKRMLECVAADDRARELLVYCGAERTGRFAGRGIQVHNLPKGRFPKWENMDSAVECVKEGHLEWAECLFGDVMNLLASCLRGAIIAPPGKVLILADYAAIEARCVLWEAGADGALEVFRRGEDIYCDMASGIYGYLIVKDHDALEKLRATDPERAAKAHVAKTINSMGATQRDFGKVAVLGLGYGMGFIKFLTTLRTYNIRLTRGDVIQMMGLQRFKKYLRIVERNLYPQALDFDEERKYKAAVREAAKARKSLEDELEDVREALPELALCKFTVETYRKRYPEVKAMWSNQERAAIAAIRKPGRAIRCGPVVWKVSGRYLMCKLPSGRCLHYANPELKPTKTSWGETKPGIRFHGRHQKTKKWVRQATYGGKLVENITQAIARDIMCFAKVNLADDYFQFDLILDVHDEIIAELSLPTGEEACHIPHKLKDYPPFLKPDAILFEKVLAEMPSSMDGCPIAAEARVLRRYRK
jgi:DNA polymerase